MAKLIIIRGNSGCGKSTTAKLVRNKARAKTALVEQDYLRRTVLKEKEVKNGDNIALIRQTVEFAAKRGYNVVLEGILYSKRYQAVLEALIEQFTECYIYYLDVTLEETLRRHKNKPDAQEFGEKEMREWYKPQDLLGIKGEKVLDETYTQTTVVNLILADSGL